MTDPPNLPMEVIAQIIPLLRRPNKHATGRDVTLEDFHQKDLTNCMRVSIAFQEVTARHLYEEVVVSNLVSLLEGLDRPVPNMLLATAPIVSTGSSPEYPAEAESEAATTRVIHKADLLKKVRTLHFAYSRSGKKQIACVRQLSLATPFASNTKKRLPAHVQATTKRADKMVEMIARMGLEAKSILPNLDNLTFATWQSRQPPAPQEIARDRLYLSVQPAALKMADLMARMSEGPSMKQHAEGIYGGARDFPLASNICRTHCEGPPSDRFVTSVPPGRVKEHTVHNWDMVDVPNLVFGAANHIVIDNMPDALPESLATFALASCRPIIAMLAISRGPTPLGRRTELTIHFRVHQPNGMSHRQSPAEHPDVIRDVKAAIASVIEGGWPDNIHVKIADPKHRCSACGELLDPSGPDLAARIANLSV